MGEINILAYLEKSRQKLNYSTDNTTYYRNYIENLSKFNKMEQFRNYFIAEILILDLFKEERAKFARKLGKKLNRTIESSKNDQDIYFKYANLKYLYFKRKYQEALALIKELKNDIIFYDSFLRDLKFIELACSQALNLEIENEVINEPWHGLNLCFENESEKQLFYDNNPVKGSSYERRVNFKASQIRMAIEKANRTVEMFTNNINSHKKMTRKYKKKLLDGCLGWKNVRNISEEFRVFLDENMGLTEEFSNFCDAILNIYTELDNFFKPADSPVKNIDYDAVIPEAKGLTELLRLLGKNDVLNFNLLQLKIKEKLKEGVISRRSYVPMVPEFFDMAYDFVDEISSDSD